MYNLIGYTYPCKDLLFLLNVVVVAVTFGWFILESFFSTLIHEQALRRGFSSDCSCLILGAECVLRTRRSRLLGWQSLEHFKSVPSDTRDLILDENVLALWSLSGPCVYTFSSFDLLYFFSRSYLMNFFKSVKIIYISRIEIMYMNYLISKGYGNLCYSYALGIHRKI